MTDKAQELRDILHTLEDALSRKLYRKLDFFQAYPKQEEHFDKGSTFRQRLMMAGNQLGKTECGAVEAGYHSTGEYPLGWLGKRFTKPTRGWACGETAQLVRDVQQKKLCGDPGVEASFGTGYIPREAFADKPSLARGVTDAYDTVQVRWKDPSGRLDESAISTFTFKSYEQGRTKFQGEPVDWVWGDEEPPAEVYSEMVTRTNATQGIVWLTFTPLKGMSDVVMGFLNPEPGDERIKTWTNMTIHDALHYTDEQREAIIAAYPAHEREARANGTPMLGSGRIFQFSEEAIAEEPLYHIPPHWTKLWGVDFGIDHPFGAVLGMWDKDNDCIHIHTAMKMRDQMPLQHATMMKPIGINVPVAWPQDGNQRDKGTLKPLAMQYKAHGLKMLPTHATWPDGSVSTEAGVLEMQERMATGRLKVAKHLSDWFGEFRLYHRKDGLIVKLNDDLMSATRIFVMAKRFGVPVQLGGMANIAANRAAVMARDVDFPLF